MRYGTEQLLNSFKLVTPATSFLRDRYFPCNEATDVFSTNDVLVEYMEGSQKLAPFVVPQKNGVVVLRDGYRADRYAPANIAPKRPLTIDELQRKGFGEALYANLSPEQRQDALILQDLSDMDAMITRREEAMAAEVLQTNGLVMDHIADNKSLAVTKEIRFYDESANPAVYTPSGTWSTTADIFADLYAMIQMLTRKGLPATDLLVGSDVAAAIIKNEQIQKFLDNRRMELGTVAANQLSDGAYVLCTLNVYGHQINVITYENTYMSDAGVTTPYIAADKVVLTAPAAGHAAYGAISQVEADGEFHTYTGRRVPKYTADPETNSRSITLTSAPLLIPTAKNPWIVAEVL